MSFLHGESPFRKSVLADIVTIDSAEPLAPGEAKGRGIQKRQAVFSLDFDDWRDLIEGYGIGESIIPHRDEGEPQNNIHRQGWHG